MIQDYIGKMDNYNQKCEDGNSLIIKKINTFKSITGYLVGMPPGSLFGNWYE